MCCYLAYDKKKLYESSLNIPVNVPGSNRKVEKKDEPVHGDQHQHCRQTLSDYLWNHPLQQQMQLGPLAQTTLDTSKKGLVSM